VHARAVVRVGWLAVLAPTLVMLAGVEPTGLWVYIPFALSIVVFGLPHGAVDHLALLRLAGAPLRLRPLVGVLTTYLAIGLIYLACWFVAPLASLVFFIAMTWFHWGQGDVHSLLTLTGGRHLPTRWQRVLALVVRGGFPMLVPLLAFPAVYLDVVGWVVGAIDTGLAVGTGVPAVFRVGAAVGFAGLCLVHLGAGWLAAPRDARRGWAIDAFETALLAVFFATVHPLLAVGLYFCLWHSLRHIVRLIGVPGGYVPGAAARPWRAFALHAAPTTALALLFLVGLYALVPVAPDSLDDAIGLYLVLIAVLTLPHVWVVLRMDRAEHVWHPAPRTDAKQGRPTP
jgi:Brp/Blh family beta-carotene 15,15'-monooxygenase